MDIPDSLKWMHSADGILTMKDAYKFVYHTGPSCSWEKHILNAIIPPSMSAILWTLTHGKIPTDDALRKRGFPMCFHCSQHEETC